jgi:hypothetical protein
MAMFILPPKSNEHKEALAKMGTSASIAFLSGGQSATSTAQRVYP